METEQRPDPETSEDHEHGTPQGELSGEDPAPDERDDRNIGAPVEGGADSPAEGAREGG